MNDILQSNYAIFQAINSQAGLHPWLDTIMIFCANTLIFFWPLLLLCLWGIPLRWRNRSVQPDKTHQLQIRRAAVLWTAVACVLAYGLNLLVEQAIFEPRPFVNHSVHLLVTHAADGSFPSDHTAWSFAVVGMLAFALFSLRSYEGQAGQQRAVGYGSSNRQSIRLPLLLLLIALVVACLIGFARVFAGLHYPGDIAGGAVDGLIGAGLAAISSHLLSRPTQAVLQFAAFLRLA